MQTVDARELWRDLGPAYFRELSTFGALPDNVIQRLLIDGRVIRLAEREVLYVAGERSESFFIVLSGAVNTYEARKDGGLVLARSHQPGDDMGFAPMIALIDRPACTIAQVESTVVEISSEQFLMLQQLDPDAFGLLLVNLTRGLARSVLRMGKMLAELDTQAYIAYQTDPETKD